MRQADHTDAGRWLARHGLADAEPTPLLAARLAVRRRAKVADSLLLAAFLLGAALTHVLRRPTDVTSSWPPLLVLAVLGRPYAVFTVATFTGASLLAVSVLPVSDPGLRYGAIVVLIGLAGAGVIMQLRQVLASPAVAEDEASLTADVIMRVEDARALVTPSLVWSLPAIFLYGESLGWWNAASLALVVAGAIALCLIQNRTTGVETTARRAMASR